jgi:hypothetical protein
MKIDVDEYIREHVDLYEQHVERWTACPLKEWMSGSDGEMISELFPRCFLSMTG